VQAADLAGADEATPVSLEVVTTIAAGHPATVPVGPGRAARIMTGAPLPVGADAVVMKEFTAPEGTGEQRVLVRRPATGGDHIRRRGEEVIAGGRVAAAGEAIGATAIELLAATGHAEIEVYRRPRVAVLSTGDELVEITVHPGPGQIRNSNAYSVAAQVLAAGGIPLRYPIVPDEPPATRKAFLRAAAEADFIVVSGGVSTGDFDFVKPVLESLGEMFFYRVAMRPGHSQVLGRIDGVPFFGLPGSPTSTFVGFELFVRPALRLLQGRTALDRPRESALLDREVSKSPHSRYYLRARLRRTGQGRLTVSLPERSSPVLPPPADPGNCLLVLPEGCAFFAAGTSAEVIRLDLEEETV
jgi:molybdopterin molybdotransferase